MTSTFFGLETAKRGMTTQQTALYVTGQNISNANTPGYSRQRVNFTHTEPYPPVGLNRPQIPGQMGTGVEASSIQRTRDSFLDQQYRGENNQLGYWNTKADALSKMEDVMNEPSDNGLSATLGKFWQSLQDLSVNPEDSGARSVVLEQGSAVSETFHYLYNTLQTTQTDFGNQIEVSLKDINSTLQQISDLNKQIASVEPNGYLPNDLYDDRDRLVDQLSSYLNIQVVKNPVTSNPLTEGTYTINLLDGNKNVVGPLVDGTTNTYNELGFLSTEGTNADNDPNNVNETLTGQSISGFTLGNSTVTYSNPQSFSQGKLNALVESYGYNGTNGIYPTMLSNLDKLAYTFADQFNQVHAQGYGLDGSTGQVFFSIPSTVTGSAKSIDVALSEATVDKIAASVAQIPANSKDNSGDGNNAVNLANVQSKDLTGVPPINSGTITSFYAGVIGGLGVDAQQANRLANNSTNLQQSVDEKRQSVSAVSLDEEMINMIKYQQAYNASARNITIVDEMLDKIVNGLGTGGR